MKTISVINRKIAKEKEISLDKVEQVNNFYWKEIENKMLGLEPQTVYVKEIGSFTVSKYKLRHQILRIINNIKTVDERPYRPETIQRYKDQAYRILRKLLIHRNNLAKQFYEVGRDKSTSSESN